MKFTAFHTWGKDVPTSRRWWQTAVRNNNEKPEPKSIVCSEILGMGSVGRRRSLEVWGYQYWRRIGRRRVDCVLTVSAVSKSYLS